MTASGARSAFHAERLKQRWWEAHCFRWPVHLLRDTAAAGATARGKQITKRPQIYAHFRHVATDFAALHLGSQGSRYLSQSAPFTLAQEASISSLTICKKQTGFIWFLTVAPECCTYPIISTTSWPNTGAARWWWPAEGEKCVKECKVPYRELKAACPIPLSGFSPPLSDLALMVEALQNPTAAPKLETRRRHDRALECQDQPLTLLPWSLGKSDTLFSRYLQCCILNGRSFHKDWGDQSQMWRQAVRWRLLMITHQADQADQSWMVDLESRKCRC